METIGVQGETCADCVRIDVSKITIDYPDGRYEVSVRRVNGETYPAAVNLVPSADGYIYYPLQTADLALTGMIYIECQMLDGATRIKSPKWCFYVSRSISAGSGSCCGSTAVPPYWMDDVMRAAQAALDLTSGIQYADGGEIQGAEHNLSLVDGGDIEDLDQAVDFIDGGQIGD
jgi:hypothetical protein